MPVQFAAIAELLFAEQNAATIAELACPDAELMAAVNLCQRRHARQQRFATPDTCRPLIVKQRFREFQRLRQRCVMTEQTAVVEWRGR